MLSCRTRVLRRALVRQSGALLAAITFAAPPVHAADYSWFNSTSDNLWGTAGNWDPSGPPGANDAAVFGGFATTIDLGGAGTPRTFTELRISNADPTSLNNGVLRFRDLNHAGANIFTINGAVQSTGTVGTPGVWNLSNGGLVLTNTGNTLGNTTLNVNTGGTLVATAAGTAGGASALSNATVNLNGGTFTAVAGLALSNGFLRDQVYFRNPEGGGGGSRFIRDDFITVIGGTDATGFIYNIFTFTPNLARNANVPITYDLARVGNPNSAGNTGAYSTNAFVAANGNHNNIMTITYGKMTIGAGGAGDYTFGSRSDDGSTIYIDINQDGQFTSNESLVDNNRDQGYTNRVGTRFLNEGTYNVLFGWYQGGCCDNNGLEIRYGAGAVTEANFNTLGVLNPSAPIANITFQGLTASTIADYTTTTLRVSENSTLNAAADAPTAFGGLTFTADNKTLTVNGGQGTSFTSVTGAGAIGFGGSGPVVINGAITGATALNKAGSGALTIAAASPALTGPITQTGGTLNVNAALAGVGVVNANGGTFNQNAAMGAVTAINVGGGAYNANHAVNHAAVTSVNAGTYNANVANSLANAVTVNGGTLNLGNANVGGATLTLNVGSTTNVNPGNGNTSTFAGSTVNMDGGTLRAQTGIADFSNANITGNNLVVLFGNTFVGRINEGANNQIHSDIEAYRATAPTNTANLTSTSNPNRLRFASDGEIGSFFGNGNIAANAGPGVQWTSVFTGVFTPRVPGDHFFGVEVNDDVTSIYVDANGNGTFEQSEKVTQQGCCNTNNGGTLTLAAGTPYNFLIANEDTGGGGSMSLTVAEPTGGRFFATPGGGIGGGAVQVDPGTELRARTVNNLTSINLAGGATPASAGTLRLVGTGSPLNSSAKTLSVNRLGVLDVAANHTLTVQELGVERATFTKTGPGILKVNAASVAVNETNLVVSGGSVDLSAANVVYTPQSHLTGNGLEQRWFETTAPRNEDFVNQPDNFLNPALIKGRNIRTGPVSFGNKAAFDAAAVLSVGNGNAGPFLGTGGIRNDDFAFVWRGNFKPTVSGDFTFSVGRTSSGVDDEASFFLDLNRDGTFAPNERFGTTVGIGCCDGPYTADIAAGIVAGETYPVAMIFHEWAGGEKGSIDFRIAGDATYDAFRAINADDAQQAGWWSYAISQGGGGANVAGGASLVLGTVSGALPVNLGTASSANAALVSFSPKPSPTATTLGPISVAAGGVGTVETGANNTVSTAGVNVPSGSTLNKTGAGALLVTGTTGTGEGHFAVLAGKLGGNGTISASVSASGGGAIAPGASVGTLTTGPVSLNTGGILDIELDPAAAGQKNDVLVVLGGVSINGAILSLTALSTPTTGQTFLIVNNDGAGDAVTGTFANGPIVTAGAFNYTIDYAGGDGNDIVLTAAPVPEPAAAGLLGVAMLGLLARRRRQSR